MKIELVKASVVELKPGHKYLIAVNSYQFTMKDAHDLLDTINGMGVKDAVVAVFKGDIKTGLKVIEQKDDKPNS